MLLLCYILTFMHEFTLQNIILKSSNQAWCGDNSLSFLKFLHLFSYITILLYIKNHLTELTSQTSLFYLVYTLSIE